MNRDLVPPITVLFAVSLGYGMLVPTLPDLVVGGPPAPALWAWVFIAYAAAKLAVQIPGGLAADRWGPLRVLQVGSAGFTASFPLFFVGSMPALIAARLLEGAATGAVYAAAFAWAAHGPSHRLGQRIGWVGGLGMSGLLAGPAAGALLAPWGAHTTIAFAASASVIATGWTFVASPPARLPENEPSEPAPLRAILAVAKQPALVAWMAPIAFNKWLTTGLQGVVPLDATHRLGLDASGVSILFVTLGTGFALGQVLGGRLADVLPATRTLPAAAVGLLGGLWLCATASNGPALGAGLGIMAIATAVAYAVCATGIAAASPGHGRGSVLAVCQTATDLSTLVGPATVLPAWGAFGPAVYGLVAVAGIITWTAATYAHDAPQEAQNARRRTEYAS